MKSLLNLLRETHTKKSILLTVVVAVCASVCILALDWYRLVELDTSILVVSILFSVFLCGFVVVVIVNHKRTLRMETPTPDEVPQEELVHRSKVLIVQAQTGPIDLPNPRDLN